MLTEVTIVLWFVYDSGCISLFTDASVPLWHHRRVHAKCKQERTLNMTEQQAWIYTCSLVRCLACGHFWRTKAKYVDLLADATHKESTQP